MQRLYSDSSSRHPGSVCYAFVFRYLLTRVLNSWYMPTDVHLSTQVAHSRIMSKCEGREITDKTRWIVVRVTLGHSVKHAERGDQCFNPNSQMRSGGGGVTWRELANIPNHDRPYNSLFAAAGAGITRFRYNEYVVFHSDQTYPEYVLAYHRR